MSFIALSTRCSSAFLLLVLLANGAATADDYLVGERPNAGGPPDEITVRAVLLDISAIDDKAQLFNIDAYYEFSWHDPRLAVDTGSNSGEAMRSVPFGNIWMPRLTIVNDRGIDLMLPQIADIDGDGNVVIRQRLSGELAVDLDLRRFPFDTQQLSIDIVSYRYLPSELVFSADSEIVANTSTFSADGWRFETQQPDRSENRLVENGDGRSMIALPITAHRMAAFFVLTLALPMTLILFMSWTVHWLQPDIIPARIGMSTATVFSLIALGVSFRLTLPRVDYLTLADYFVICSTLLVLVSLGVTVIATRWINSGHEERAVRLTRYALWGFPVAFALIVIGVLMI